MQLYNQPVGMRLNQEYRSSICIFIDITHICMYVYLEKVYAMAYMLHGLTYGTCTYVTMLSLKGRISEYIGFPLDSLVFLTSLMQGTLTRSAVV